MGQTDAAGPSEECGGREISSTERSAVWRERVWEH